MQLYGENPERKFNTGGTGMELQNCDWCQKPSRPLREVANLGVKYKVCADCADVLSKKVCRVCKNKVKGHLFHGMCILCYQVKASDDNAEVEKEAECAPMSDMYESTTPMSDAEYTSWMTRGPIKS